MTTVIIDGLIVGISHWCPIFLVMKTLTIWLMSKWHKSMRLNFFCVLCLLKGPFWMVSALFVHTLTDPLGSERFFPGWAGLGLRFFCYSGGPTIVHNVFKSSKFLVLSCFWLNFLQISTWEFWAYIVYFDVKIKYRGKFLKLEPWEAVSYLNLFARSIFDGYVLCL